MEIRIKKPPKNIRKYIRREKARLKRSILDINERQKLISQLYQKIKKINPE